MESNVLIAIGKRIAEIRKSHNITQETLADQLGVSPKHISHTECGKSSLSLKNLIEFCHLYDCSLDYIVTGKTTDLKTVRCQNCHQKYQIYFTLEHQLK